jgi:hypothetical protein
MADSTPPLAGTYHEPRGVSRETRNARAVNRRNSDMHNGELKTGMWWQDRLVREIALVLVVKIALIFTLWWLFFDLPDSQHINTSQVGSHLLNTPPAVHLSKEEPK